MNRLPPGPPHCGCSPTSDREAPCSDPHVPSRYHLSVLTVPSAWAAPFQPSRPSSRGCETLPWCRTDPSSEPPARVSSYGTRPAVSQHPRHQFQPISLKMRATHQGVHRKNPSCFQLKISLPKPSIVANSQSRTLGSVRIQLAAKSLSLRRL